MKPLHLCMLTYEETSQGHKAEEAVASSLILTFPSNKAISISYGYKPANN